MVTKTKILFEVISIKKNFNKQNVVAVIWHPCSGAPLIGNTVIYGEELLDRDVKMGCGCDLISHVLEDPA